MGETKTILKNIKRIKIKAIIRFLKNRKKEMVDYQNKNGGETFINIENIDYLILQQKGKLNSQKGRVG